MPTDATFDMETSYWQQGISCIAGVDEVGMGALAGPVVGAAVIFSPDASISGLRDSKKLSSRQRERLAEEIKAQALAYAVGEASVEEIFSLNILQASRLAMKRSVERLSVTPTLIFVDGRPVDLHPTIPSVNFIKGDCISASIAAASILAKVHRDAAMVLLDEKYPGFDFASHKGYGSAMHMSALRAHGATAIHRAAYSPIARLTKN